MKNNKAMAIISWIISLGFLLTAVSIGEGNISKMVIGHLVMAVCWLIIGIIYWNKSRKKNR